jgi:hypothetical protein
MLGRTLMASLTACDQRLRGSWCLCAIGHLRVVDACRSEQVSVVEEHEGARLACELHQSVWDGREWMG